MNFVSLYRRIDQTNSTLDKTEALRDFFTSSDQTESDLTVSLILGFLPPKRLKTKDLMPKVLERAQVPEWLFDEAYASVGDLAETISLMVAKPDGVPLTTDVSVWLKENITTPEKTLEALLAAFDVYDSFSIMVLLKLITGGLRMGVARGLLIKALAKAYTLPEANVAHSLMGRGEFKASNTVSYIEQLKSGSWNDPSTHALPYPFALASPIDDSAGVEGLGEPDEWSLEWKWDGIRGQFIYRNGGIAIWSRGEDLLTDRFPELHPPLIPFESVVLDGEILAWKPGESAPMPFQDLQTRIGRKKISEKVMSDAPIRFLAYDCLELNGEDLREKPFTERRKILADVIQKLSWDGFRFGMSEAVDIQDWNHAKSLRLTSRENGVEGFMLKRKTSPYFSGRKKGDWWKWKIDPMTLDAVLIYAQAGHGKRSNLFTDYTFALKDDTGKLVPVAKAYSGLDNKEIQELDRWIRNHTHERFGPVRSVDPEQVFELGFEGISESGRHKSGIALRFPRILRWRKDKPVAEIDELAEIRKRYLDSSL